MTQYAIINSSNIVSNKIEWDGVFQWEIPTGYIAEPVVPNNWIASTNYAANSTITASGSIWQATQAGISSATEPTWPTSPTKGTTVNDNGIVWTYVTDSNNYGAEIGYGWSNGLFIAPLPPAISLSEIIAIQIAIIQASALQAETASISFTPLGANTASTFLMDKDSWTKYLGAYTHYVVYNQAFPTSLSSWLANTSETLDAQIVINGNIWQAIIPGISGAIAPTWPASPTIGTTLTDGNNVIWTYQKAVPGAWTANVSVAANTSIVVNNGIWNCTTAGTSGATAPTWPTTGLTAGTTTQTDNTVTWTYEGQLPSAWTANTNYAINDTISSAGSIWQVTQAGMSGSTMPTWPASPTTGTTVIDISSITWSYTGPVTYNFYDYKGNVISMTKADIFNFFEIGMAQINSALSKQASLINQINTLANTSGTTAAQIQAIVW